MYGFKIPFWSSAIVRSRQKFYDTWTPTIMSGVTPPWVSLGKVLRFHRLSLRRALRQPVTFANIDALYLATHKVVAAFHAIATAQSNIRWQALTARQLFAISRLQRMLRFASSYLDSVSSSQEARKCFERDLARLFAKIIPVTTDREPGMDDVLCVFDRNLVGGIALQYYVQSCSFDPDGIVSVVRFPGWVYDVFATLKWCNIPPSCSPELVSQVESLYGAVHHANISDCCEVPTPEVLELALSLWSHDDNDMYSDIATAVSAVQRLN